MAAASGPLRLHVRGLLRGSAEAGIPPRRPAAPRVAADDGHRSAPPAGASPGQRQRLGRGGGGRGVDLPHLWSMAARPGWTRTGVETPIGWPDVLVVAAYNAQVGEIRKRLPDEARVGTVDKFQGQEAPISIYSMASSSAEDAPRGMKFLYSRNRLNVATSRARCVAVVVASPGAPPRPRPHPRGDAACECPRAVRRAGRRFSAWLLGRAPRRAADRRFDPRWTRNRRTRGPRGPAVAGGREVAHVVDRVVVVDAHVRRERRIALVLHPGVVLRFGRQGVARVVARPEQLVDVRLAARDGADRLAPRWRRTTRRSSRRPRDRTRSCRRRR